MGCACNRRRATAGGAAPVPGTYRVYVDGTKVYETTNARAAETVAKRFSNAEVLEPGKTL